MLVVILDIKLLNDIEIDKNLSIKQNLNLNLNGYKIINKVSGGRTFSILEDNLFINIDGTIFGSEIMTPIAFTSSYGFFDIKGEKTNLKVNGGKYYGPTDNGAQFKVRSTADDSTFMFENIHGGITSNTEGGFAFMSFDSVKKTHVTVNNSNFETEQAAFVINVENTSKTDSLISFNSVTATSNKGPVIECCGGYTIFNNCTFNVENVHNPEWFSVCVATSFGGIAEINGGTYNGALAALSIYSSGGKIIINEGTFNGKSKDIMLYNDQETYPTQKSSIIINGGKFINKTYTAVNEFCELINYTNTDFVRI